MGAVTSLQLAVSPPPPRAFGDPHLPRAGPRGWDFLGSCPAPLRMRMRDDLSALLRARHVTGTEKLKCCMPMGHGGRTPFDRLRYVRDLQDFPKLLVSSDHGNAFNRAFHAAHVERGAFISLQPKGAPEIFTQAGLIDPRGWVAAYAVAPFVLLVDRVRLGARPVPQSWADLADPLYRGEVVFSGWRRDGEKAWRAYNQFFLMALLRLLGENGLKAMLVNVPGLTHSAQMPRIAGTAASLGAVYVLPWAMAGMCPRRDRTEVVWPREGALAFPLWMTAQQAHVERIASIADYFFAEATARWLDHNLYPSLSPGARGATPPDARLYWPGWDYLRHLSSAADIKKACALFHDSREHIDRGGAPCA